MVNKIENLIPTDEPRITFNYSGIHKNLPGTHLELNSKIHDYLSDFKHGYLFAINLKLIYPIINLYPDDRRSFASTISGIDQIQPTRLFQKLN